MSTAAEVRAASTVASSSDDRKASTTSRMQEVRHPVKDRQPVAKDGQLTSSDRHPVARDKVEKVVGKASPESDEKQVQRRASEVCFLSAPFATMSVHVCYSFPYLRLHAYSMPIALFSSYHSQTSHYRDA